MLPSPHSSHKYRKEQASNKMYEKMRKRAQRERLRLGIPRKPGRPSKASAALASTGEPQTAAAVLVPLRGGAP
jgi:hypothetical protein